MPKHIMKQYDETHQVMTTKMGDEFGSLFYHLYNETVWLTIKWLEYNELYGTKPSRIDLMNQVAPQIFFIIEKTLWNDILLGISRITDPPETYKKRNITFQAITKHIEDAELKNSIEIDIKGIIEKTQFCRDWRNRSIAHFDYDLNINEQKAEPLAPANRNLISEVMKMLQDVINRLNFHYLRKTVVFDHISGYKGAVSLLVNVEKGLRFKQLMFDKKHKGEWKPDGFESLV